MIYNIKYHPHLQFPVADLCMIHKFHHTAQLHCPPAENE